MTETSQNVDHHEVAKFNEIAFRWWDPESEFKPLHEINPLRLDYVKRRANLKDAQVIDVGCGGGILSESLASSGAKVTGIDLGENQIQVAKLHLLESGLDVEYLQVPVEEMAQQRPAQYDVVTCMEMLEHVPDPQSIVQACCDLLKPGGQAFFSTLNRNPKSYLFAVIGAEYMLNILPKGTHDYRKFIKPSELGSWIRHAGLELKDIRGMSYNPISKQYSLGKDIDVNYLVHAVKPE